MTSRRVEPLAVRVLGPLDVDGVKAADLGSRKARTLLTALAVAQRPLSPEVAADVVWQDALPSAPGDQLSVLASRLRRALGADRVVKTPVGYELRGDWFDVVELRTLVADAEIRLADGQVTSASTAASAALALDRGELAAGETAPWFDDERRAVEAMVLRAHSVAAEAALGRGDYRGAAASARRLLDADPYDESAALTLMRALNAAGRPSSALSVYAALRRRLVDDLGASPSATVAALHRSILQGDAAPAQEPRASTLVGRARELAQLVAVFDSLGEGAAGVVVEGAEGMGKSALAAAFAATVREHALVLQGRCDPQGRDLPLQPVIDALQSSLPAVLDHGDTDDVGSVVGRLLAERRGTATTTDLADTAGPRQRAALHSGLVDLAAHAGRGRPVVLIIEDLQWADTGSLEWLELARRTGRRLMIVATGGPGDSSHSPQDERQNDSPLEGFERLELKPLDEAAVADLVGPRLAGAIHGQSGGLPLLVVAGRADGAPGSIGDLSVARVAALGERVANVVRVAAVLGPNIDLDLVGTVLRPSAAEVLDDLDVATAAQLLVERGGALGFQHELVRTAVAASVLAPRRTAWHHDAAAALDRRPTSDPVELAWHARLGQIGGLAVTALRRAATEAALRFEPIEAESLLDQALEIADDADARIDRARVRLAAGRLDAARVDAERALELRYDARALETLGWIAYYRRDHDTARACADAGLVTVTDANLRASLLALAGRHRHSRGELAEAATALEEAITAGSDRSRGLAVVWLAGLRVHTGAPADAAVLAARGSLDAIRGDHPFAQLHALFARALALGQCGRIADALTVLDQLDAAVEREGLQGRRFRPRAMNTRAWLLRNLGRTVEADGLNGAVVADTQDEVEQAEAHYVANLDLVEGRLLVGDPAAATALLDGIASVEQWQGAMAWRQQDRYRLARARIELDVGDPGAAVQMAERVRADAARRGSARYDVFAHLVAQQAQFLADRSRVTDRTSVQAVVDQLSDLAAPESWWITARLAASWQDEQWWDDADRSVAEVAAKAGPAGDELGLFAAGCFTRWRSAR